MPRKAVGADDVAVSKKVSFDPSIVIDITKEYADGLAGKLVPLFSNGESAVEVCAKLGLTKDQYIKCTELSEMFARADAFGHTVSEAWWMESGRLTAEGTRRGNTNAWLANMKNRHGWSDKDPKVEKGGGEEGKTTALSITFVSAPGAVEPRLVSPPKAANVIEMRRPDNDDIKEFEEF